MGRLLAVILWIEKGIYENSIGMV